MQKTIESIQKRIKDFKPQIGIVLGSGLGDLADEFCEIAIPYSEIEGFPISTVEGHKGQLVFGIINGKKVVMMQGRFHFYEGYSMESVTYPIKVMKKLGVETVFVTNAAGGVNPALRPSSLMLITDHLNFMGTNPLIGKNDDTLGTRFPDMSEIYTKSLRDTAKKCAKQLHIELQEGVYAAMTGPSYETPAEVKMLSILGASAVGMSTAPEAIIASHCKMNVLGISCICNSAAGISEVSLTHEEVLEAANVAKSKFKNLVLEVIKEI